MSDDKESNMFFDAIDKAYDTSPRNDTKIVLGDLGGRGTC